MERSGRDKTPKNSSNAPDDQFFSQTMTNQVDELAAGSTDSPVESKIDEFSTLQSETQNFPPAASVPKTIGRYRMLKELGCGGMGVVWLAEQQEPVKRHVAVKIIRTYLTGLYSQEQMIRFHGERQALAMMNHPNIAKVIDGGTTTDGAPYLVLEYVKGVPLTKYCDERKLGIEKRLALFVNVCHAIQHAHQKGIIHRDIKPSNILIEEVDGKPVPKVIDFGLAKATDQNRLTEESFHTKLGQVVGTYGYMSPEQTDSESQDIDTRTDVYSLGATLYELLVGKTWFDKQRAKGMTVLSRLELVRRNEIVRPSHNLSHNDNLDEVLINRDTDLPRLTNKLQGELDWIVMRAMEKDRDHRYNSASDLAEELNRFLAGDAVSARPHSFGYRISKAIKKHRVGFSVVAAIAMMLVASTAVSSYFALWALNERSIAQDQRTEAQNQREAALIAKNEAVASKDQAAFYFNQAFNVVDKYFVELSEDSRLKDNKFAALRRDLLVSAKEFYDDLAKQKPLEFVMDGELGRAKFRLAIVEGEMGNTEKAVSLYRESLEHFRSVESDSINEDRRFDIADTQLNMGALQTELKRLAEARRNIEQAVKIYQEYLQNNPGDDVLASRLGNAWEKVAYLESTLGNYDQVANAFAKSIEHRQVLVDRQPENPVYRDRLFDTQNSLAALYRKSGMLAQAIDLHKLVIEGRKELLELKPLDPESRYLLSSANYNLGIVLADSRDPKSAEPYLLQTIKIRKKLIQDFPDFAKYHKGLASAEGALGYWQIQNGQANSALETYASVIERYKLLSKMYPESPDISVLLARSRGNFSYVLNSLGKSEQALQQLLDVSKIFADLVNTHPQIASYHHDLALSYLNIADIQETAGKLEDAKENYSLAKDQLLFLHENKQVGHHTSQLVSVMNNLGKLYFKLENYVASESELLNAKKISEQYLLKQMDSAPEYGNSYASAHMNLAKVLEKTERKDEALDFLEKALQIRKELPKTPQFLADLASTYGVLGNFQKDSNRIEKAKECYLEGIRIAEQALSLQSSSRRIQKLIDEFKERLSDIESL